MPRYFIEVSYKGTGYAGFQIQQNANSIQAEVEKAMEVYYRQSFNLTGSSRTDAGVHALQNFFHFDCVSILQDASYNLNAILPEGIVIKSIKQVSADLHCRFNAVVREYSYYIYQHKNPFIQDRAWFYPFPLNLQLLQQAAVELYNHSDFTSFSKRNTQTNTKLCQIKNSNWKYENDMLVYTVSSNRFLRGMVRGLVATMLQVGKDKISLNQFVKIIEAKNCTLADFSAPAHGLFLNKVSF
jgi:tRNA pseudouridine38-40 synthase